MFGLYPVPRPLSAVELRTQFLLVLFIRSELSAGRVTASARTQNTPGKLMRAGYTVVYPLHGAVHVYLTSTRPFTLSFSIRRCERLHNFVRLDV
ncbi:hypothetical protein BJV78DRAFT_1232151 [Lactifluus subvellereus]|nr:hypothetical protein BJV78DRAFT_1232151 [Lactifluus subvellereus]